MQSKKQAVWLVVMLSLMMGISAFYLVTDPVNPWDGADEWVSNEVLDEMESAKVSVQPVNSPEPLTGGKAVSKDLHTDALLTMHQQKQEQISKITDEQMKIINDSATDSDAMNQAYEAVAKLEDQSEKMTVIEEKLSAKYHDAVVMEEQDRWKVYVPVNQLTAKQASEIVGMVMSEMQVGPGRVMIQLIP